MANKYKWIVKMRQRMWTWVIIYTSIATMSNWLTFFEKQLLFCWAASFECICWNLTFRINIRIYSWGEKSLEWMFKYICFGKIHEYLGRWIYLSINIQIYLNIQIFATHCYICSTFRNELSIHGFPFWHTTCSDSSSL